MAKWWEHHLHYTQWIVSIALLSFYMFQWVLHCSCITGYEAIKMIYHLIRCVRQNRWRQPHLQTFMLKQSTCTYIAAKSILRFPSLPWQLSVLVWHQWNNLSKMINFLDCLKHFLTSLIKGKYIIQHLTTCASWTHLLMKKLSKIRKGSVNSGCCQYKRHNCERRCTHSSTFFFEAEAPLTYP